MRLCMENTLNRAQHTVGAIERSLLLLFMFKVLQVERGGAGFWTARGGADPASSQLTLALSGTRRADPD